MRQKGFTLFTALVSFLLIMLAALLVHSMIRTERNTTDTLGDVREQSEMEAVADLARADALQIFNYSLRYTLEGWLIDKDNPQLVTATEYGWDELQRGFAFRNFGGCVPGGDAAGGYCGADKFANRVTSHLLSILRTRTDFGAYELSVDPDKDKLFESVQKMLVGSIEGDDFFRIIKCDASTSFQNCTGSFYINLNTELLDAVEFEELPMIHVHNNATGRTIEKPVLPQGNFQIYVPVRLFKAFKGAKMIADDIFKNPYRNSLAAITVEFSDMTAEPEDRMVETALREKIKGVLSDDIGHIITSRLQDEGMGVSFDSSTILIDLENVACNSPGGGIPVPGGEDYECGADIASIELDVRFKELESSYMVNDYHNTPGQPEQVYTVRLLDTRTAP